MQFKIGWAGKVLLRGRWNRNSRGRKETIWVFAERMFQRDASTNAETGCSWGDSRNRKEVLRPGATESLDRRWARSDDVL